MTQSAEHSPSPAPSAETPSSINPEEVARFNALAQTWWDPSGAMGILHKFNPSRLKFIKDEMCVHFQRSTEQLRPFEGLSILDIGCGGGLICEPLARFGADVTGVDPAPRNTLIAQDHARGQNLDITYRAATIETLNNENAQFDVVLALEVIEHVAHQEAFVQSCVKALKPNGLLIMATLNRTPESFALAIIGAEYILRWLPKGTHSWKDFVTPREMQQWMKNAGAMPRSETGVIYNPLTDRWSAAKNMRVNYMIGAAKF